MKLVLISDTHNARPVVPDGDVVIHAGDLTMGGTPAELQKAAKWWNALPHPNKIFIAGNHDWGFERMPGAYEDLFDGYYLEDGGVEIDGTMFWGSPYQPEFCNWAFNVNRGEKIKRHWDLIPDWVDVLITHGPPKGILDECEDGFNAGCEELSLAIERVKPKVHVFGHIHEGYGTYVSPMGTTYVNASHMDFHYKPVNTPIEVSI
jgi:calcineurin-like phosphoesterase family protein